jgi:hypothetical protein
MKRRAIIRTLATIMAAFAGKRAVAQQAASVAFTSGAFIDPVMSVSLDLVDADAKEGGIGSIHISYHGETVTLTAKEIFEALK